MALVVLPGALVNTPRVVHHDSLALSFFSVQVNLTPVNRVLKSLKSETLTPPNIPLIIKLLREHLVLLNSLRLILTDFPLL